MNANLDQTDLEAATHSARIDYAEQSPALFRKYIEFNNLVKDGAVGESILDLITIRASQMNGCGLCVDLHVKLAKIHGERELRLHHIAIWRESQLFTPRERAALAWTEVLTRLPASGVPDELYNHTREQFTAKEISDLTFAVMAINGWNRINVAFQTPPGLFDAAYNLDRAGLN